MGLIEAATAAITGAERRIEVASKNIANVQTPGYKREIPYTEIAGAADSSALDRNSQPVTRAAIFTEPGVLTETGNRLDLAVRGEGYVLLRDGDRFFLARGGQFQRDREGALVDTQGRLVQQAGGGDLLLDTDSPEILPDGTVVSDGVPAGNIGLYAIDSDVDIASFKSGMSLDQALALTESDTGEIAQGMVERSNVILSDEMIGLMRTQRMAEAGAQMVRAYDQLLGQAIATFGRRG